MIHLTIFLQGQGGGGYMTFVFLGAMMVVMYFFMIRPQMKRAKDEKRFQAELKKGERVVTTSGIHGKIFELNESTVIVETGAGKITFERSSVSREFTMARFTEKAENKK